MPQPLEREEDGADTWRLAIVGESRQRQKRQEEQTDECPESEAVHRGAYVTGNGTYSLGFANSNPSCSYV